MDNNNNTFVVYKNLTYNITQLKLFSYTYNLNITYSNK